jgi:hypothetical protein
MAVLAQMLIRLGLLQHYLALVVITLAAAEEVVELMEQVVQVVQAAAQMEVGIQMPHTLLQTLAVAVELLALVLLATEDQELLLLGILFS